ncbi:MAG: bifunctional diaminohydroxyphosphoribosylaminopyrimidine deaminase/5-amino-6-(5-phosphoribosylamino)uracil reductase RibD, partial [Polyangiaceae bacterium]|nr:bifunctional diaminohydroxyphosphoribosylaminopyrimidine deaminase/5-amino-6-(5-phosphoribosylamino)uracil reductase RibD [Polyangiaceae bacterium]
MPTSADIDAKMMSRALTEARKGRPSPNPHVGAVIAKGDQVLSVGHHERVGTDHAEVVALRAAGAQARDATLYVTLEPCNHHGRTPPCVEFILQAGVKRVVVGCRDPNPEVEGGGAD